MTDMEKKDVKVTLIVCLCIFLVILLIAGIIIYKRVYEPRKMPDWGNKYYDYLKNFKTESKELLTENNVQISNQYQGNLYYYKEDTKEPPVLILDSKEEENDYMVIVLLIDNEPKDFVVKKPNADIELLYNIEKEEYYYYFMYEENNQTHFIKLTDYINYLLDNNYQYEEIVATNGEKVNVDGVDLLKVETLFIEPNKPEIEFDYKPEEITGLRNDFSYYINDVKKSEKVLKDSEQNGVKSEIERIKPYLVIIEQNKNEPTPEPTPEPEPAPPVDDDPGNCRGTNPFAASNPCICEEFTGCINDLFSRQVCGIGKCISNSEMTQEECDSYGGELSNGYCYTDYK